MKLTTDKVVSRREWLEVVLASRSRQRCRVVVGAISLAVTFLFACSTELRAQGRQFALEGLQGDRLTESDIARGAVVAIVWATWSPRSRDIVSRADAIVDQWGDRATVIMVSFQEDHEEVASFLAGRRPRAKVYLDKDGSFSKRYSVTNLPGLVVFKEGTAVFSGKLGKASDQVIAQALD